MTNDSSHPACAQHSHHHNCPYHCDVICQYHHHPIIIARCCSTSSRLSAARVGSRVSTSLCAALTPTCPSSPRRHPAPPPPRPPPPPPAAPPPPPASAGSTGWARSWGAWWR